MPDQMNYWIELSEYDLETAEAMLKSKRYLYVGFMAHQTIEKIFKAYFVKIHGGDTPPYSHSLSYIAKKAEIYDHFSEKQKDFIDMLEPMNIECRYPVHKDELIKSLTEKSVTRHLIPGQKQGFFFSQFQDKYPAIDIIFPFNSLKPF